MPRKSEIAEEYERLEKLGPDAVVARDLPPKPLSEAEQRELKNEIASHE
jgi:hypothetical protein